ncbi:hypothetical protein NKR23_g12379 [Pleurostoma richardsiae]|uniref:Zn(2)-C6 fungal-type domain-containing protein n=1 Tax=Pleurostoma richardsiae TaxID=41990 RepID=A0AA38R7Q4_9PEZI|nr:hypothetical protein NKR23_g12379 [Pleurostoma richardsiae]
MPREHLTLIACSNCRKKRTKCDGKTPCGRCRSRNHECCYESKMWRTKGQLRAEIDRLRAQLHQAGMILDALTSGDDYRLILDRLRKGEAVATIARDLRVQSEEAPESDISATSDIPSLSLGVKGRETVDSWFLDLDAPSQRPAKEYKVEISADQTRIWPAPSQTYREASDDETEIRKTSAGRDSVFSSGPATSISASSCSPSSCSLSLVADSATKVRRWTGVTNDDYLIRQLLFCYFSWEHPIFTLVRKKPFQVDFEDGRERYCSSALVNAILAVACRFLDSSATISITNGLADRFVEESHRLISLEHDKSSLTRIQAIGVLALKEAAEGHQMESHLLAKQCAEEAVAVAHASAKEETEDDEYRKVKATTICGGVSLYRMLSLLKAFSASHDSQRVGNAIAEDIPLSVLDDMQNIFYSHVPHCEPSSTVVFELTDLAHASLFDLFIRKQPVKGPDLIAAYTKYLSWYESTFENLRRDAACTPAVLFLHIYFQYCLMLLLRPFARFGIVGAELSPRAVCLDAARAISRLASSSSRLFTLRRAPCFLPFLVLAATLTQVCPEPLPAAQLFHVLARQRVRANEQLEPSPLVTTTPSWNASTLHTDLIPALVVGTAQLADMSECHPLAAEWVCILVELRTALGAEHCNEFCC